MPVGFQAFNEQGVLVCDITDRFPKVVMTGVLTNLNSPNSQTISVPGMTADGSWFVTSTEQTIVVVGNGSFRITRVDQYGIPDPDAQNIYYSVYKQ